MARADEVVIRSDGSNLDLSQRRFVYAFVRGGDAQALSRAAGYASLLGIAAYYRAGDDRAREAVWKHATGEPIVIVDRGGRREIGIESPGQEWLARLTSDRDAFERSLPGFEESWLATSAPAGRLVVADLVWRRGDSLDPVTILPLDDTLLPEVGRSFIVWKNVLETHTFERQIRPAIREVLSDEVLARLTPAAFSNWSAMRLAVHGAGPEIVGDVPLRTRLGDLYEPLQIAKADVLAVVAGEWLSSAGARPASDPLAGAIAATATAFFRAGEARRGAAASPDARAAALLLSWLQQSRAVRESRGRWTIDGARLLPAFRGLATEILRAEAAAEQEAVASLFQKHPLPRSMSRAADRMAKVPVPQDTPRYDAQAIALP